MAGSRFFNRGTGTVRTILCGMMAMLAFLLTDCAVAGPPLSPDGVGALPVFLEVTKVSGVDFFHSFGDDEMSNIVEATGAGCAFLDYDNDGWMDVYLVNGGLLATVNEGSEGSRHVGVTNRLYRNNEDGTFTDMTEGAGCGDAGYGMGCVVGDVDNDGDDDLYVTNYGRNTLYRNHGDGTFSDVTVAAGVGDTLWSVGCALLDADNDGDLDLYVGNYLEYDAEYRLFYAADRFPGPLAYAGQRDTFYRNHGDGTFAEETEAAGVANSGRAMGVIAGDYNGDGWTDIFVANDAMENYLYRNDGDGAFTDVALEAGVAFSASGDASSSMGGDFGDYDNDGDLDLLVPDMGFNNLYMNRGRDLFEDVTAYVGLAEVSGQYASWAGDFGDFNNDGYLDILLSNGDVHRLDAMEALMLTNVSWGQGPRVFRDLTDGCGAWFRHKSVGRGMAVGDYDNDGDLDMFILNLDQPSQLVRNEGETGRHWLMVALAGTQSNRDGIGARVIVRAGDLTLIEEKRSATGYLSQNDPRLHFGLGRQSRVDEIEVRWPGGTVQRLSDVAVDQVITIVETER